MIKVMGLIRTLTREVIKVKIVELFIQQRSSAPATAPLNHILRLHTRAANVMSKVFILYHILVGI
jgi:hypothetical protein